MVHVKKALISVALAITVCSTALLAADDKPAGSDGAIENVAGSPVKVGTKPGAPGEVPPIK